jgi:hypothetical protein
MFDPIRQEFVGEDWITGDFEWKDVGDVERAQDKSIRPWSDQHKMQDAIMENGLLNGFAVESASFDVAVNRHNEKVIQVRLQLHRSRVETTTKKTEALFYTSEIEVPGVVGLTPAVISPGSAPAIQIHAVVPEYFGLRDNLRGDFREIVLSNGDLGQSLVTDKVDDLWGVVRLRYPISLLRNPVLASLATFNGWDLVLTFVSLISGAIGFWIAIVTDVVKDN